MPLKAPVLFDAILHFERSVYRDERGAFSELFRSSFYRAEGVNVDFVQDNLSVSKRGVIRGMHFQTQPGQAKLVTCLSGEIFDVFVDIRPASPTFGKWGHARLSAEEGNQVFIPTGFAHGFAALSQEAIVLYKVSSPYCAQTEKGFYYDDPEVGISWPVARPILSERDASAPPLREVVLT